MEKVGKWSASGKITKKTPPGIFYYSRPEGQGEGVVTRTQRQNSAGTGCPVGAVDLQKEGANPQCPDLQRAQGIST